MVWVIELYTPIFIFLLNFVADACHFVIAMYLLMFCHWIFSVKLLETHFGARATHSSYLKDKSKKVFQSFKIFWKIYLVVGKYVFYKGVKFQYKIHCTLGYKKMTNCDNFGDFENVYCSLFSDLHLSFLCRPEYNTFLSKIYTVVVYIPNYIQIHFHNILKLQMVFIFFQQNELHVACPHKCCTHCYYDFVVSTIFFLHLKSGLTAFTSPVANGSGTGFLRSW
jgi:hypothetical protein